MSARIVLLAAIFCLSWFPFSALPQVWPAKQIRLVVPATPGGVTDILARLISQKLTVSLGQPLIPDYRPGANMILGADLVAKSAPDGYTLFLGASPSHTFNPLLRPNLPYDAVKDFEPVILVVTVPYLLATSATLPVRSVQDLLRYARDNPGKLSYGSWGSGSVANVGMELLKLKEKVDILHVPYKGTAAAETDLMAGRLDVMITTFTVLPQVKEGRVRALATTAKRRTAAAPDIPTTTEAGLAEFEVSGWYGLFAPAGTSKDIVRALNAEVDKALKAQDAQDTLRGLALDPEGGSPERLATLMRTEQEKWGRVIRDARIKVD
jgi:tripartite-type tricarboxylate transporter receptor subunit TctC